MRIQGKPVTLGDTPCIGEILMDPRRNMFRVTSNPFIAVETFELSVRAVPEHAPDDFRPLILPLTYLRRPCALELLARAGLDEVE